MERFRSTETNPKPIVLDSIVARSIATALRQQVITKKEEDKLERLSLSLPEVNTSDKPTTSIRNSIHGIRDTIQTLATAQEVLVVPTKDEADQTTGFTFTILEKGKEPPQAEEGLTTEEESDKIEQALNQNVRRNLSAILSAAEVIIRDPYSTEFSSTDTAEEIIETIRKDGKDSMTNRLTEFTKE